MTKKEKELIEKLASIMTKKQGEHVEYVYIAHALYLLSSKQLKRAETDIEEFAAIINIMAPK